ncbi:MAG: hypothetical protein G01um101430_314 [Parcubacteria group bacterium Gr01-1014_30]|nr:MAG: hypothetical protein G01um101430_314 [Parcubacteria group bacterium Gr01-1014_30]
MSRKYPKFIYFLYNFINPIINPHRLVKFIPEYLNFFKNLIKYFRMGGAEKFSFFDLTPSLYERTPSSGFDRHYFYQDIWAARRIIKSQVKRHIDVGSRVDFVGFLSAVCKVTFVDIRPLEVNLKNFESVKGNIISLPFKDNSIPSLSCLHVAEHIGLGRYGDKLDPKGTERACRELTRVLAKGGNLYFSLPVGKPKLCFNAHRIHSPEQILQYFSGLKLVELSGVNDKGIFREKIAVDRLKNENYACGLFWFKK